MSWLLDVNFLLACSWRSHVEHAAANAWLARQTMFATCPLTELGMLRVSLSPGYRASFADAAIALAAIKSLPSAQFVHDDLPGNRLPPVTGYADVTDAYLVMLARAHHWKLATLDDVLCRKPWAAGAAINPLRLARRGTP